MKKSEILTLLRLKASEICEVRDESIISGSKCSPVVDARMLIVQYARRMGLSNEEIALQWLRDQSGDPLLCPDEKVVRNKAKTIRTLFNTYSERCLQSKAFRLLSVEMRDFSDERFREELNDTF